MLRYCMPITMANHSWHLSDGRYLPRVKFASIAVLLAAVMLAVGCSSNRVTLRSIPQNPLINELQLTSYYGPRPSEYTEQVLRLHNLTYESRSDPRPLIKRLQAFNNYESTADRVYAMSELAYLGGMEAQRVDKQIALDLYGASVLYSYQYLFDDRYMSTRNPYDPQYRKVCDLYNGALESALRIVCAEKSFKPDTSKTIHTASGTWDITCTLRGSRWRPEDFDRFEFVSDYEVNGLKNHYLMHGLGVPLIAVRRSYKEEPVAAKYYPADLSFPVTAFLRPLSKIDSNSGQDIAQNQGVLELYDPLTTERNRGHRPAGAAGKRPDHAAGLFSLQTATGQHLAWAGLLRPETLVGIAATAGPGPIMGLYMVQPYEPGKIPVLMVHGLWSSPMTWMEMFNDLRSQPEIRDHYQFWFYLYPTGQPFWLSAANCAATWPKCAQVLDPNHQEPALDQMVLIGHSMGGLVSQAANGSTAATISGILSARSRCDQIKADPEVREKLQRDVLLSSPIRRSAAWSPSARRTAAARFPTRPRNGCWTS